MKNLSPKELAIALCKNQRREVFINENFECTVTAVHLEAFVIEQIVEKLIVHAKSTLFAYGQQSLAFRPFSLVFDLGTNSDIYVDVTKWKEGVEDTQKELASGIILAKAYLFDTVINLCLTAVNDDGEEIWESEPIAFTYEGTPFYGMAREDEEVQNG